MKQERHSISTVGIFICYPLNSLKCYHTVTPPDDNTSFL